MKEKARFILNGILILLAFMLLPQMTNAQELSPEPLIKNALDLNPELKSLDFHITALRHKSGAVQKWLDPVFAVEFSNFPWDSWQLGDSPMTGVQFKVQQTFTLIGKNKRREATVLSEAKAAKWLKAEKRNQLAGQIRLNYWNLALVRQLREITNKHIKLVAQLIEAVRAKYQAGKTSQHNLMRLEVLRDKLRDDLNNFEQHEHQIIAAINAVLHRTKNTNVNTPADFYTPQSAEYSLEDLIKLAKKNRPLLKALQFKARTKRLAADQGNYERWPDITLWAGYRIRKAAGKDDGSDQMTLGLAIPLPLDYKGRFSALREMNLSEAFMIDEKATSALDDIRAKLISALAAFDRAIQKSVTYEDKLIPGAKQTLDSTLAAYQTDRADFVSLYQVELQLLEFERTLRVAKSQALIELAKIKIITGTDTLKVAD